MPVDKTALTKSAMGYFHKNTLAEGSEEVGSDIINLVADVLISKDKSEWQTSIDAYEAEGMTEKEAFWRAVRDQAENMGPGLPGRRCLRRRDVRRGHRHQRGAE